MRKAVVIGGANGIGLAIVKELMERGYSVKILDIAEPRIEAGAWEWFRFDMCAPDDALIETLAADEAVEAVMLTAGIGRVAPLEALHTAEIEKLMRIDSLTTLRILRQFYDRMRGEKDFYCGVMGSIAGWVSSPLFSVYAAAKASVCRFVESVNIELEMSGRKNRILNVSPTSIKGTSFNGGNTDTDAIAPLAKAITDGLFAHETVMFPNEELCKDIIGRYNADPHAFGVSSYQYKAASGRMFGERRVKIGYLSGTFDLFHIGHLNLLRRAKEQCDYLIVGVHESGAWKGKETFIPFEERKAVVAACRYVDKAVKSCREDSDAWDLWHYDRLFVGSDYKGTERFKRYEEYFADKGVEIVYFPYTQGTSSTQLRAALDASREKK